MSNKIPEALTESGFPAKIVKERGCQRLKASPAVTDGLSLQSFLPENTFSVGQDGFSPLKEEANLDRVAKSL